MRRPLPITARFSIAAFVPIGLLLVVGFFMFGQRVEDDVRDGIGQTLAEAQKTQAALRREAARERQVLVAAFAENPVLKAGLTLWRDEPASDAARRTVEDQLQEMGTELGADLMGMVDASGRPIALLGRFGKELAPMRVGEMPPLASRLVNVRGALFDTLPVPVNTDQENLGVLFVGRHFEASEFHTQAVLMQAGKVVEQAGAESPGEIERGLARCTHPEAGCPASLGGSPYLALRADTDFGDGYTVWTLHPVERAANQILGTARNGLWAALAGLLLAAFLADFFGARAVARPLIGLVDRLKQSEKSGVLAGDFPEDSSTREVNELARAFNLAARSVADSQRRLDEAYLQITQTMAQTLDARDPYTAGHSMRVSHYAAAIAEAMNLTGQDVERIRVGANFHDIGKIGIPDSVLQKPDPLTAAEFEVIKQHPTIGKRILEGVVKFHDYLSIVELHHENHDGTGYPWGLRGEGVPLGARIVHVVDAYDAMTTSRPYRGAMPPEKALDILKRNAGTQFDPAVVEVFLRLAKTMPDLVQRMAAPAVEDAKRQNMAGQLAALESGLEMGLDALNVESKDVETPAS